MSRYVAWLLRHRVMMLIFWSVVTAAGAVAAPAVSDRLQDRTEFTSAGYTANEHLVRQFGLSPDGATALLVELPPGATVDSDRTRDRLARIDEAAGASPGVRTVSYAATANRSLVGEGGRSTVVLLFAAAGQEVEEQEAGRLAQVARESLPGATTHVTSLEQLGDSGPAQGVGALAETVVAGLAALVILAWVFGSVVALVPLITAIVSILTMQLLLLGLTHVVSMPFDPALEFIVAVLGLGLSIDYALLMVTRWRDERASGAENEAAVAAACRHAGRAVVISGVTASIGLFALIVVPVSLVRGIGVAGLFIPSTAMLVSVTLLPALLRVLGPRLDWPRRAPRAAGGRAWRAWARQVVRHRWAAAAAGVAVLGALCGAAVQINIAEPAASSLPVGGSARAALTQLHAHGFTDGLLTTLPVIVGPGQDPGTVATDLAAVPGVRGAIPLAGQAWQGQDGSSLVLAVPRPQLATAGTEPAQVLAAVRRAAPSPSAVAGDAALEADLIDIATHWLPIMLGLVALATFAVLAWTLRSVVLPLKAVLLNLLSVAAVYGVVVLVWQYGWGSEALYGIRGTGAVAAVAPILLFGFLFGLSMDYEVFLLARMREEYARSGRTRTAIVEGLGHTGRLVTSAALILFCALVSLSAAPDLTVKIIATGLAAGVLLDATVVRCLLMPALVAIMGRVIWWFPGRGDRRTSRRVRSGPPRPQPDPARSEPEGTEASPAVP